MDPTNFLYPDRHAREEFVRQARAEIFGAMSLDELHRAGECRPDEPATAAERLAEALLPNIVEVCALVTEAESFAERSVRAAERPLKVHRTLAWKTTWAADFLRLHTRLREMTKAHTMMAHAARKWREAPGLGDEDADLTACLNGIARALNDVKGLLDTAGRSRVGPKVAAA